MKQASMVPLRQERERRGWSRNYVAEQVEVDVITVGRWERGERMPHPHHRQKLCTLFEMNAQDLGLVTMGPQMPDEGVLADSSGGGGDAATGASKSSLQVSSAIPESCAGVTEMATEVSPSDLQIVPTNAEASADVFRCRRRLLLMGLGGLGMATVLGSGLLLTSRLLPASTPAIPVPMPLSKRLHHFLDANTSNWVNHMTWSPDGTAIAVASGSNVILIWNIEKGTIIRYYPTLNGWVNDISWSHANLIAATTADFQAGSLQLWKFPEEEPIFTLQRSYGLRSVSWSPDGKYLALSGRTSTVEVWDPFASYVVSQYTDTSLGLMGITRVKWSASGKFLACIADDGTAHVWEALTGKPRTIYHGHKGRGIDLAWSPDERYIVSASGDKTSHVWEVAGGHPVVIYRGHTDEVEGVDWSPHGTYIVSGSADHTAHVWEPFTGKLVTKYEGRSSTAETVLWSMDGATLAIGSDKEGVEIWQAP